MAEGKQGVSDQSLERVVRVQERDMITQKGIVCGRDGYYDQTGGQIS